MAKISPVSIKYMIHASFKSEGPLEKPDVIGAIFGQTEGLLGQELEMRELQKEGKIGRIEVELENVDGKSVGEIKLPSALDKSETTIIAAALETIDRIGPTEARIQITKIEDVRGSKRNFIVERAKRLLGALEAGNEIEGISRAVKEETRAARIQEYGDERLPAGDLSGNEIIVVEGRADVINLLKNRVNNVIGMNGTKLPAEIAKLGEEKELTLFIDGDRGGRLIAQNVMNNARIFYVAVAPDGKEVEELAGKEILIALRRKIPANEYLRMFQRQNRFDNFSIETKKAPVSEENKEEKKTQKKDAKEEIKKAYEKIKGNKKALLLNENFDTIKEVSAKEVAKRVLASDEKIIAIVIDGQATASIIKASDEKNVEFLAATTFGSVENARVNLISL